MSSKSLRIATPQKLTDDLEGGVVAVPAPVPWRYGSKRLTRDHQKHDEVNHDHSAG